MTPYDKVFYPIFGIALLITVYVAVFAAGRRSRVSQLLLLGFATISAWLGLALGSDLGFRFWQSLPDPPPEAFSDAFPTGAIMFGWAPAGLFAGFCFAVASVLRRSRR